MMYLNAQRQQLERAPLEQRYNFLLGLYKQDFNAAYQDSEEFRGLVQKLQGFTAPRVPQVTVPGVAPAPGQGVAGTAFEQIGEGFQLPGAKTTGFRTLGEMATSLGLKLKPNVSADLHTYGAQYYLGWAERTAIYTRQVRPDLEWVPAVCERFSDLVPDLLAASQTVIHGEYYPKNILVRGQRICPVDWQSAAIAAGEVDLASLTEGHWPEDLVPRCESAYAGARWPGGPPASFERSLAAARLYWPLRWLGERPERTAGKRRGYFDVLLAAAQRLGLASGGAQWLR